MRQQREDLEGHDLTLIWRRTKQHNFTACFKARILTELISLLGFQRLFLDQVVLEIVALGASLSMTLMKRIA